jgi:hypothetical protein
LSSSASAICRSVSSARAITLEDELDAWLEARTAPLRAADRRYWRPIIDELRELKRNEQLMAERQVV